MQLVRPKHNNEKISFLVFPQPPVSTVGHPLLSALQECAKRDGRDKEKSWLFDCTFRHLNAPYLHPLQRRPGFSISSEALSFLSVNEKTDGPKVGEPEFKQIYSHWLLLPWHHRVAKEKCPPGTLSFMASFHCVPWPGSHPPYDDITYQPPLATVLDPSTLGPH